MAALQVHACRASWDSRRRTASSARRSPRAASPLCSCSITGDRSAFHSRQSSQYGCNRTRWATPRGIPATAAAGPSSRVGSTASASTRSPAPSGTLQTTARKAAREPLRVEIRRQPPSHLRQGSALRRQVHRAPKARAPEWRPVASVRTRAESAAPLESHPSQSSSSALRTPYGEEPASYACCWHTRNPAHQDTPRVHGYSEYAAGTSRDRRLGAARRALATGDG